MAPPTPPRAVNDRQQPTVAQAGLGLDVWCEPNAEATLLQTELAFIDPDDRKRRALLLYELGRVQLAAGDDPAAAQAFLESYKLRPQFRPTLRAARLLYVTREDFQLAIKLLDAEARATRDPLARASLLRLQARLRWSTLGDLAGARSVLEQAYRIDAADLATIKLQVLLATVDRDEAGLRSALLRQLETVADKELRVALMVDLALLLAPTDASAAIDTLDSAARSAPGSLAVQCYLEQLYEAEGRGAKLAGVLVAQGGQERASPPWRARQLARAARVQRDAVGDPAGAIDLFRRSLELHPEFGVAADCFELLVARDDHAAAVQVGDQLFELDETPTLRASVAARLGDICRLKLDDRESAGRWYERCLRWAPSYQPALEGLGWILEEADEVDRLIAVHRADLAGVEDPRARAQRLYRIASLLERHERDAEAMEVHQEALSAWATFQPSLSALERLFTRHERWAELLQLYDGELEGDPDQERALHVLETMASIWYHQLQQPENAIEAYRRILGRNPDHLPTLRAMARLCAETARWHDLVELNERELSHIADPRRSVELLQRTGEVWEHRLLNLDQAMECYRRVLQHDPRFLPALKALGRLYRQKGRWSELIEMHQAEIRATDDTEQVLSLLYDVAEIYEEELIDEIRAASTYREVLRLRPGHLPAVTALERILRNHGDWQGLVELMQGNLDRLSDSRDKALLLWSMGALRESQLADTAGAIKDYARALRLAPDLAPARAALEQILEESGDLHQLADLHGAALEQAALPSERAAIGYKLADLWEHDLANPRKAALLYERAVEHQPSAWCLRALSQIYERLNMTRELCSVLEQLAALLDDDAEAARIHLRIGHLKHSSGLGDPLPSLALARSASGPGRRYAQRTAEAVLRESGRQADLTPHLVERIELVNDPVELACLWTELAHVHLRRDDPGAAERAFREALAHSQSHISALFGLGRLLEQQGRWQERAELAEAEAGALESNPGLADALFRAGVLWEDRVGDVQRAIPLYRRVQKIQPGHAETYGRLHAILTGAGDWSSLASLIRSQITATQDPLVTAQMFIELARLYLERLQHQRKGEACLRRALDLDPTNLYALGTLGDLSYDGGKWDQALRMYTRLQSFAEDPAEQIRINRRMGEIYLGSDDPRAALDALQRAAAGDTAQDPELLRRIVEAAQLVGDARAQVAALERLAECSPEGAERVHVRKRLAQLAETALENDDLAVRALEETLVLDPLDIEAIERLAAIYGRASNRSAANQHLQAAVAHHRAELARSPFEVRLYGQLGRIFQWQRLFDRFFCTCVVQHHLGGLDDAQQRFLEAHRQRCNDAPGTALSRERYEALILPHQAYGPLRDVLASAGPGLQKRAAVKMNALGLDKNARVRPDHTLRLLCDQIAALAGGIDYDLYISPTQPELIAAEMLGRPSIVLGQRVASDPITAAERFRIGKALFLVAEQALVLRDLSVREIGHLFVALGQAAQPPFEIPITVKDPGSVEKQARALSKLLARRERKALGAVLPGLGQQFATVNLAEFARALGYGSNHMGLVAAGDPVAALHDAAHITGASTGPEMADLVQYVVSEEYFAARIELGIAPGLPAERPQGREPRS